VVAIPVLVATGLIVAWLTSPSSTPDPEWDVTARQILEGSIEGPVDRAAGALEDRHRAAGAEAARKVVALKTSFDDPAAPGPLPARLSVSIGYTEIPAGVMDILPFIQSADRSMYMDKGGFLAPS